MENEIKINWLKSFIWIMILWWANGVENSLEPPKHNLKLYSNGDKGKGVLKKNIREKAFGRPLVERKHNKTLNLKFKELKNL